MPVSPEPEKPRHFFMLVVVPKFFKCRYKNKKYRGWIVLVAGEIV
jgi:hypothetical protein